LQFINNSVTRHYTISITDVVANYTTKIPLAVEHETNSEIKDVKN